MGRGHESPIAAGTHIPGKRKPHCTHFKTFYTSPFFHPVLGYGNKKPVANIDHGFRKTSSASATRLSQGFTFVNPLKITFSYWLKVRNQVSVSFGTRGFPPHDYSWFGFIDVMNDGYFLSINKMQSQCQSIESLFCSHLPVID